MKKKNVILLVLFAVVVTAINTYFITNILSVDSGDKVVVTNEEYDRLLALEKRFDKLLDLETYIKDNYYKDTKDINFDDSILKGLFESLEDPYSVYMTDEEYKDFTEVHSGEYSGIGVVIAPNEENIITIVAPIEDSPGQKAGLINGDQIIKVNGEVYLGSEIDIAITHIKGEEGTPVNLTIRREGVEDFDVEIVRETIIVKAVDYEMKDNSIGYISISTFDDKVFDEFEQAITNLIGQKAKSIIIDLRNNPGGSLYEVYRIADLLLGEQVIVSTKDRFGNEEVLESDDNEIKLPIVVLVNEGSASASEILTGAIKDTESGTVIGSKTFGKGIVQSVEELEDGSAVKLTTSEYFTPSGVNIHGIGIEPDINIDMIKEKGYLIDEENDGVLNFAIDFLKEKL
jgi:carboxyl-terminal processing protease